MENAEVFRGEEHPPKKDKIMSHVNIQKKVISYNAYTFFKGAILNINIKHRNDNSSKQETSVFRNIWMVCLETVSVTVFMCSYVNC